MLGCLRIPRIRQRFQALFPNKAKPTRNIDRQFNRKAETTQECFNLYETLCSTPSKARCGRAEHLGGTCVRNQRACLTGKLCGAVPGPIVHQKTSPAHAALKCSSSGLTLEEEDQSLPQSSVVPGRARHHLLGLALGPSPASVQDPGFIYFTKPRNYFVKI